MNSRFTNVIPCSLTVKSRSGGRLWDMQLGVQRPLGRWQFHPQPLYDAVLVAFGHGQEITAQDCIYSLSSEGMAAFHLPAEGLELHFTTPSFTVPSAFFLLTDILVPDAQGSLQPLFYGHRLPPTAARDTEVLLLDAQLNPASQVLTYLYRTTAGTILYNNLAPEVQHPGTPCGAFYVYYLDIYGCPQYALLNNEPAYQLLTVDVYDEWDTTQRYYRLQDLGHQFLVEVLFDHKRLHPDFRMFVVRLLPRDFGEITFPTAASLDQLWYPRLRNFDFYYSGALGAARRYQLKDYEQQNFVPHLPYKHAARVTAQHCNDYLIRVPHTQLVIEPAQGLHLELLVYTPEGKLRLAGHTDSTRTVYYDEAGQQTSVLYLHDFLASYSCAAGLLHLNYKVEADETILVSYHYRDAYLDYPHLNLNPKLTPEVLLREYALCLMPVEEMEARFNLACDFSEAARTALAVFLRRAFGDDAVHRAAAAPDDAFWRTARLFLVDTAEAPDPENETLLAQMQHGCLFFLNQEIYTQWSAALPVEEEQSWGAWELAYRRVYNSWLINAQVIFHFLKPQGARITLRTETLTIQPEVTVADDGWFTGQGWFLGGWFGEAEPSQGLWPGGGGVRVRLGQPTVGRALAETVQGLGLLYASLPPDLYVQLEEDYRTLVAALTQELVLQYKYYPRLFQLTIDSLSGVITASSHPYLDLVGMHYDTFLSTYTVAGHNTHQFLVLWCGGASIPSNVAEMEWVDCRRRGGGLKAELLHDVHLERQPQWHSLLDVGRLDGRPFPGSAAVLIELPYWILQPYGGTERLEALQERLQKFLGAGIYPVVRFYGAADPEITSLTVANGSLSLSWTDTGGPYTVYCGADAATLKAVLITQETTATISDLPPGTCTVLVTPIRHNSAVLGQRLWITTVTA